MFKTLLLTKLYIPPPRTKLVLRRRLIDRLNAGLDGKLTVISAPAGFGKTTLVSEWVANCGRPTAWLSLDEGDNDPTRFLTYFAAAVGTIASNVGQALLIGLQSPQPPPTELILTTLLNEIASAPSKFVLVLDDYHLIDAKSIDSALVFLLEHLPPQMRLVMTTREDPNLPLARLRARGHLTELRAADLRFTPDEAADFLNQVMGLSLSVADITTLEDRTEGWIAGLQLAAISMQGSQNIAGFIREFAGDHQYVLDYLLGEVLDRQSESVRQFLLQTAVLDRLNGVLCDAVTNGQDGNDRLKMLERGNFFVVPLDNRGHWYRYHHLFAQVLYTRLMAEQGDKVATLHLRASIWYEQNDMLSDAVHHALTAHDFARAANLIERAVPGMRQSRQEPKVLQWLKALPEELFASRPVLNVHYAGVLIQNGKFEGVEARLQDAERWLDRGVEGQVRPEDSSVELFVVDQKEFHGLAGSIAMYRAAIALASGDVTKTMKYAQQMLELIPEDDHLRRGAAAGFMGLSYWTIGDLDAAHQSYMECMARLQKIGYISDIIGCLITLADIQIAQGHLRDAMSTYERGLQLAIQGATVARGVADMHVGISTVHRERNDLGAATQHLLRSKELGEFAGLPQNQYRWCVAMARLREAEGDFGGALDLLDEAERLYASDFSPNVRPIPALKALLWIVQGRVDEALGWVHEQNLSVEDDLSYLREFEHITLARLLLTRYKSDPTDDSQLELMGLLDRLLQAAKQGQRTGSIIEILVLQALFHQTRGDITDALAVLQEALILAEPEDYVRMFIDEGSSMVVLLEEAAKSAITPNYVRQLLRSYGTAVGSKVVNQALIDPLSERELEVLRLLGTELDGPDIARQLIVSLNTVRTHTKNIYTKLGVNNRRAAIRRAEELDLL